MSGLFITFEGGEGGGKSTQTLLMSDWLTACQNREIVTTREPGGTELAEDIRCILVNGRADKLTVPSEALLMIAARTEHVEKIIKPALHRNAIILCDRFSDSTLVYQGLAHNHSIDRLNDIHDYAFGNLQPDITFLLDLPAEMGLKRSLSRQPKLEGMKSEQGKRFEDKGLAFHQSVRSGFLKLAKIHAERFIVIDASQSIEHSTKQIKSHIIKALHINTEFLDE